MTVEELSAFLANVPDYLRGVPVAQLSHVKGGDPDKLLEVHGGSVVGSRTYPAWGYYVEDRYLTQHSPPDGCIRGAVFLLDVGP